LANKWESPVMVSYQPATSLYTSIQIYVYEDTKRMYHSTGYLGKIFHGPSIKSCLNALTIKILSILSTKAFYN